MDRTESLFCSHFLADRGALDGCTRPGSLVGSRASDVPAPPGAPSVARNAARLTGRRVNLAGLLSVAIGVALIGAGPALADRIEDKQAEAQGVLADIEALDAELGQSIEAYNAATIELDVIKADLRVESPPDRRRARQPQDRPEPSG